MLVGRPVSVGKPAGDADDRVRREGGLRDQAEAGLQHGVEVVGRAGALVEQSVEVGLRARDLERLDRLVLGALVGVLQVVGRGRADARVAVLQALLRVRLQVVVGLLEGLHRRARGQLRQVLREVAPELAVEDALRGREVREVDLHDGRALRRQCVARGDVLRVGGVRDADPRALQRGRLQARGVVDALGRRGRARVTGIATGDRVEQQRRVADGLHERAERVLPLGDRHDPGAAPQAGRRPDADDVVLGRGRDDRALGVGADRQRRQARRGGDAGAARGAARDRWRGRTGSGPGR